MFERIEPAFKVASALLAGLLLFRVTGLFRAGNPLNGVDLPDLAVLAISTNPPPPTKAAEGETKATPGTPPGPHPGMPGGGPPKPLPTNVQTQVDTIQQSEILGRLPRPQPLMLLGIAGQHVFLQTSSGQSGLAAKGEELGGVKVLQIGTNRVLVEVDGKPQELILFPGLPGESLLSDPPSTGP